MATTKHFYACVDKGTDYPLGYVQAFTLEEAFQNARIRWPHIEQFLIHRWDGIL